ncbi:diacylglycerol/polyprenol kinase family protein [Halocalculus aciditolerans]|uniref:Dolichol kinase n=1 Tax=Halocalculus aciditolerans TaxID=1383812 RepID=A0A830F716_9EURY|nr:dolichol kinase [Halocalculus aciditolerans]GGL47180.1 hypothetical protein GCM10009039_01840 [Halocalculus aciditolerans]
MSELPRRAVHVSGALGPLTAAFDVFPWWFVQAVLVTLTGVCFVLEYFRLRGDIAHWWVFEKLTRDYEQDGVAGYVLYVVGMTATAVVFPEAVAIPALLFLTIGDPVGGMLDTGDGDRKPVWVMAAVAGVCTILGVTFGATLPASVLAGAVVALTDGLNVQVRGYFVDDNLTIPILSALTLSLAGVVW